MTEVQTDIPCGMALIETEDGRWFPAFAPVGETPWVHIVTDITSEIVPPAVDVYESPAQGYANRKEALEACRTWYEAAAAPVSLGQS